MLDAVTRRIVTRPRRVLVGSLLLFLLAGIWGGTVFGALVGGGFDDPGSESSREAVVARDAGIAAGTDVVLRYRASDGAPVDASSLRSGIETAVAHLPGQVTSVTTPWSPGAPGLISADHRSAYVFLTLAGGDEGAKEKAYADIADRLGQAPAGLTVQRGGDVVVSADISSQVGKDIERAEIITMPIVALLLVIVFGGLAAAGLPLLVGGFAVLGAFAVLHVVSLTTDVSIFALNVVTMIGLGLAIDYALLILTRFRLELAGGNGDVAAAVTRTMATAGRTVFFSGITVAAALSSLLLFPQLFLRSMGMGGMAAVLAAMLTALTVLPAMLMLLGRRVDSLAVPGLRRLRRPQSGDSRWARIAHGVMRRPAVYAVAVIAVLLALGSPFLHFKAGGADVRAMPAGAESRIVTEVVGRELPSRTGDLVQVTVGNATPAGIESYVTALRGVPGVTSVELAARGEGIVRLDVRTAAESRSATARRLLQDVRAVPAPAGASALVGGDTARLGDLLTSLHAHLPWAALWVTVVTLLLLFLAFGSVVLPIKAVLLNALSLSATFGVIVWGFQDGHLANVLGFSRTGTVEATQPVLILAIAFGLSMDYEVFLLSRIREEWDRTHDNATAVANGLARTGSTITSAAALLVVVVAAFASSSITFIAMIGVGLAVAIIVDATLVRVILVPAMMRLLGDANWWAPRPLRRVYERFGFRDEPAGEAVAVERSAVRV